MFDQSQVMHGIKDHVARVVGTRVICNHLCRATDDDPADKTFDPNFAMAIGNRYRVIIAAIPDYRRGGDLTALQVTGFKGSAG